jgi:hypothetical protein
MTVTDAGPGCPVIGTVAVIVVSLRIVKVVGSRPKNTAVALRKPVPVKVALPPPMMDPLVGFMLVRVGGGMY